MYIINILNMEMIKLCIIVIIMMLSNSDEIWIGATKYDTTLI